MARGCSRRYWVSITNSSTEKGEVVVFLKDSEQADEQDIGIGLVPLR